MCHSSTCWIQPKSQPHISGIKSLVSPETKDEWAVMGANSMVASIIHGLSRKCIQCCVSSLNLNAYIYRTIYMTKSNKTGYALYSAILPWPNILKICFYNTESKFTDASEFTLIPHVNLTSKVLLHTRHSLATKNTMVPIKWCQILFPDNSFINNFLLS